MSVSELIAELDAIIARFRYVKYGDIWLSADHNDPIDAIKKLRDIVYALSQAAAPPPAPPLEGDYSTYTLMWKRYYGDDAYPAPFPNFIYYSESLDRLFLVDCQYINMQELRLSDGTLISEARILQSDYHDWNVPSALVKYFAVVVREAGIPTLKIYKDGSLIQTIDLKATLGWTSIYYEYTTVFSRDGKYLFTSHYPVKEYALFKGS
jgi:hypothetical protein